MLGRFLCFIGLHDWLYLNAMEDCRMCARKDCHKSQIEERTFCDEKFSLMWKDID